MNRPRNANCVHNISVKCTYIHTYIHTYLSTAGVPPIFCTSSMTYFPDGFKSAKNGVRLDISYRRVHIGGGDSSSEEHIVHTYIHTYIHKLT